MTSLLEKRAFSKMKQVFRHLCLMLLTLNCLVLSPYAISDEPVYLAASDNVDVQSLGRKDLAAIFLGQKRHWPDGTRIKIALLDDHSDQLHLLEVVAERSPGQYWAHWRNIVFSGRGIMPRIFDSQEDLLDYLKKEKGAIGQLRSIEEAEQRDLSWISVAHEGVE